MVDCHVSGQNYCDLKSEKISQLRPHCALVYETVWANTAALAREYGVPMPA
jgi:hypothetical protein